MLRFRNPFATRALPRSSLDNSPLSPLPTHSPTAARRPFDDDSQAVAYDIDTNYTASTTPRKRSIVNLSLPSPRRKDQYSPTYRDWRVPESPVGDWSLNSGVLEGSTNGGKFTRAVKILLVIAALTILGLWVRGGPFTSLNTKSGFAYHSHLSAWQSYVPEVKVLSFLKPRSAEPVAQDVQQILDDLTVTVDYWQPTTVSVHTRTITSVEPRPTQTIHLTGSMSTSQLLMQQSVPAKLFSSHATVVKPDGPQPAFGQGAALLRHPDITVTMSIPQVRDGEVCAEIVGGAVEGGTYDREKVRQCLDMLRKM